MQRFCTGVLALLIILLVPDLATAQSEQRSEIQAEKLRAEGLSPSWKLQSSEKEDYYNPWTIHRKVASYGLAGSIAATFLGSIAMDDEYFATTAIPVVGPFVTITRIESDPNAFYRPGGKPLLIASGLIQSAFLVYLTVTWIGEASYDARHGSNLSVKPVGGARGTGVSLTYQF